MSKQPSYNCLVIILQIHLKSLSRLLYYSLYTKEQQWKRLLKKNGIQEKLNNGVQEVPQMTTLFLHPVKSTLRKFH